MTLPVSSERGVSKWLPAKVNIAKKAKLMPEYFTDWHYEVLEKLGLSV